MTKQEIEQAIEKGESVWCVYKDTSSIYEIKAVEIEKVLNDTFLWGKEYYANIKDVYKTKAEAEHYLHHANVTRTETLPFLTWEEFKIKKSLRFKRANDFIFCEMSIFKNQIYIVGYIEKFECFGEATEANFYKAYDECVALFRGKAND